MDMVRTLTHPEDLPATRDISRRALDPVIRSSEIYSYRIIRPDNGEIRWIQAHGLAKFGVVDGVETALTYSGSIQDVTERRAMRDALVLSRLRSGLVLSRFSTGLFRAMFAMKEIENGNEIHRRVSP